MAKTLKIWPNFRQIWSRCESLYLSSFSRSKNFPFFFQKTVGVGIPFGGAQISLAVWPRSAP